MKKLISIALLLTFILAFASCSQLPKNPVDLGKKLDKAYGDDAQIFIMMSKEDIESLAKSFDISDKGVYAVLEIETSDDGMAYVIYCEKTSQAKDVEEDCSDFLDELDEDDYIVKRSGKVVFVGSEDILDEI